jgi:hypothetical protein
MAPIIEAPFRGPGSAGKPGASRQAEAIPSLIVSGVDVILRPLFMGFPCELTGIMMTLLPSGPDVQAGSSELTYRLTSHYHPAKEKNP